MRRFCRSYNFEDRRLTVKFNLIGIGQQQPTIWQQFITMLIKLSHRRLKSHFELRYSPGRRPGDSSTRPSDSENDDSAAAATGQCEHALLEDSRPL